ncbi:MAG: uroporphyrinogen-III synthase [Alphaproteobacteria bacterium]|nr:uroporphyrinogen-III synthase [Alphaproteobacteria bacterium]
MNASAKGVLLTRPMPAAASTIDALKQRGFVVYHQPLLHLAPTHAPRPEGVRADAIIITSQNSFCFWHPPHDLCEVPCYIVGQKTAEAAAAAGFKNIAAIAEDGDVLAKKIVATYSAPRHFLWVGGEHRTAEPLTSLQEKNHIVHTWPVYSATMVTEWDDEMITLWAQPPWQAVLLYSARTAEALVRGLSAIHQQQQCRGMMAFCLSPAVARAAGVLAWQKVLTPAQPEEEKLLQLLHHTLSETP